MVKKSPSVSVVEAAKLKAAKLAAEQKAAAELEFQNRQAEIEAAEQAERESEKVETPAIGQRQFSTADYLTEYLKEHATQGTWESLCKRTGFRLGNVRQAITMLRSEFRANRLALALANPDFLAKLASTGKEPVIWADEKACEKFPFLNASGTRNTEKAKLRRSWEDEELSL